MLMVCIYDDAAVAAKQAAATIVHAASKIVPYRTFEMGGATGNTPVPFYAEFVSLWPKIGAKPGRLRTWNLDEYCGLAADHPQSYRYYMNRHLHGPLEVPERNRRFPGEGRPEDYDVQIARDTDAGGVDIGILGIGRTGHIGFCEPGALRSSKTHRATLHGTTRTDAVREFGSLDLVPTDAITMGVSTVVDLWSRIFLLAFGEGKSEPVRDMLEGPIDPRCPASFLREHRDVTIVLDRAAASKLKPPTVHVTLS